MGRRIRRLGLSLSLALVGVSMPTASAHAAPAAGSKAAYKAAFSDLSDAMRLMFVSNNTVCCRANGDQSERIKDYKAFFRTLDRVMRREAAKSGSTKAEKEAALARAGFRAILLYAKALTQKQVDGKYVGNCGEMSAVLFHALYHSFPDVEFSFVEKADGDHAYVLARVPGEGDNVFIVDPWNSKTTGPVSTDKAVEGTVSITGWRSKSAEAAKKAAKADK